MKSNYELALHLMEKLTASDTHPNEDIGELLHLPRGRLLKRQSRMIFRRKNIDDFDRDFEELRQLARKIYHEAKANPRAVTLLDGPVLELAAPPWPHDKAADLIAAWQIETRQ